MKSVDRKLTVFLCHASQDKPIVRDLYQRLSLEGWIDPWLDEEKLLPGHDWDMEIEKAVEAADVVIVCLSNNSVTKEGYVQRELKFALDIALEKPEGIIFIIPIRLDDCPRPRRLRRWHSVDYFPASLQPVTYKKLMEALKVRSRSIGKADFADTVKKTVRQKLESWEIEELKDQQEADFREWLKEQTSDDAMLRAIAELELKDEEDAETFSIQRAHLPTLPSRQVKSDLPPDRWILNGMEFCRIPAGKFLMGSADNDKDARPNEKPQHKLDISYDYWMARFPVTNEQYAQYAKTLGARHSIDWRKKKSHPVVGVSWGDARAYCQWLNYLLKEQLPPNYSLRLPTEAEWEKAARGTGENLYPWGSTFDTGKCNSCESGKGGTTPVGLYSPQGDSPYNCADMSGNVWEWTRNLLKPYSAKSQDEPELENLLDRHAVVRGGSYDHYARSARCAYRSDVPAHNFGHNIGFRVAVSPFLS